MTFVRSWDTKGTYIDGFVKEYTHWVLEVSFRQHTLGFFIIFAKRDIENISDLHDDEISELPKVMREFETTLLKIPELTPDRFNYLQLGNGLHHLHFHAIPRYASPRNFDGKEWVDVAYGHPPIWSEHEVDRVLVIKIKKLFLQELHP